MDLVLDVGVGVGVCVATFRAYRFPQWHGVWV